MSEKTELARPVREEEPTLGSALERTYEAGQQYVTDRLELTLLELRETARGTALAGAGAVLGLLGWIAVMGALVLWDLRVSPELRLLVVGAAHLAAGGAALAYGLRRGRDARGRARVGHGGAAERG